MGQSAEELRQQIAETRGELGLTVDAISDHVSPARIVQRRKDRVASRWNAAKGSVMGAKESVMGSASNLGSSLSSVAESVTHSPQAAKEQGTQAVVAQTKGQPIVAGVVAFGAGFLIASAFPGSRTEGQIAQKVQDLAQPVVEELKASGQEAVEALKEPALETVGQLKEAAMSGADQVRGTAQEAIGETKESLSGASQELSDQAKSAAENVRNS
jgi:uncharacterized protein YjbJ (UPF0337 family)